MQNMKKVFGVGINDAGYSVTRTVNNKRDWTCPYYRKWHSMLMRCYSEKYLLKRPTYRGCSVCPEWHYFMAFRAWMVQQDWEERDLEKDIINPENKVYCPEWCVFVTKVTNSFIVDNGATRGEWPIGVSWNKQNGKFLGVCRDPFTKGKTYLGYFMCPIEAHLAWKSQKHKFALQLADLQTDERVAEALRIRYLGDFYGT